MCGCSHTYTEQDFADSKWSDSSGTIIEFYKNGNCNVRNIKWDSIYPSSWTTDSLWEEKHPNTFVGHWTIKSNRYNEQEIYFQIEDSGYGFSFGIENIDLIERTIGDPDDCVYYQLIRAKDHNRI